MSSAATSILSLLIALVLASKASATEPPPCKVAIHDANASSLSLQVPGRLPLPYFHEWMGLSSALRMQAAYYQQGECPNLPLWSCEIDASADGAKAVLKAGGYRLADFETEPAAVPGEPSRGLASINGADASSSETALQAACREQAELYSDGICAGPPKAPCATDQFRVADQMISAASGLQQLGAAAPSCSKK